MRQEKDSTREFDKSLEKLHSVLKQTPAALLPAGVLALADFMAEQMRDGAFSDLENDARMWLIDYAGMYKGYIYERQDAQARAREAFSEMMDKYSGYLLAVRDRIAAVKPDAAAIDEIERIRESLGFAIAPAGPAVFYDLLSAAKTEEDVAAAIERFNYWALESYGDNYISGYLAIDPEESTTEKLSTLQNALIEMYGVSRLDGILHDGRNLNELLIKLSDNPLPRKEAAPLQPPRPAPGPAPVPSKPRTIPLLRRIRNRIPEGLTVALGLGFAWLCAGNHLWKIAGCFALLVLFGAAVWKLAERQIRGFHRAPVAGSTK